MDPIHDNSNKDEELEHNNRVELATLSLPASAAGQGLEAGEGNRVILEASSETVEHMMDSASARESATPTSAAAPAPAFEISVVNLEKLSELAGVSEEDFITGLHHKVQEDRAVDAAEEKAAAEAAEEEEQKSEATPLLKQSGPVATAGDASSEEHSDTHTEHTIHLPADPFLDRLVEVLPMIDEETILDMPSVVHTEAAATTVAEDDVHHHFGHDAFLLSVPRTTTDDQTAGSEGGKDHHHFILALPEINLEPPSVQTEASELSNGSHEWRFAERAMSFLEIIPDKLPDDIEHVHLEATEHTPTAEDPTKLHLDIVVERKVPTIGYVILFSGLLALASVGAALDLQGGGVSPVMKTLWRQMATCIALLPLVIKAIRHDGWPCLKRSEWILLPVSAVAYTYMTLAFVLALEMTTLANAFVLSNMTSLVLIAGRASLGFPVLLAEGAGATIGFLGAAVCAGDEPKPVAVAASTIESLTSPENVEDKRNNNHLAVLGNLVALSASFGTAAYFLIAKKLRAKMDLFLFMFSVMAIGDICLLGVALLLKSETVTFDMHPVHGLFGWANWQSDRLPLEMYIAVVCNCLGTMGYIAVMKYFDPIVPATVMLLEPVVGALLGTAAGTAPLPGLQTWLGDLVVAGGTFLVIRAGATKTESIDATEALRPRITDDKSLTKSPLLRKKGPGDPNVKVVWDTAAE